MVPIQRREDRLPPCQQHGAGTGQQRPALLQIGRQRRGIVARQRLHIVAPRRQRADQFRQASRAKRGGGKRRRTGPERQAAIDKLIGIGRGQQRVHLAQQADRLGGQQIVQSLRRRRPPGFAQRFAQVGQDRRGVGKAPDLVPQGRRAAGRTAAIGAALLGARNRVVDQCLDPFARRRLYLFAKRRWQGLRQVLRGETR